jgi:hypothetical protein
MMGGKPVKRVVYPCGSPAHELVNAVRPKKWSMAKGARNAAIFGIVTFPLDLLMHYDEHIGGLIRMCQVGGCGEQIAALIFIAMGWTLVPVLLVVGICSTRNVNKSERYRRH